MNLRPILLALVVVAVVGACGGSTAVSSPPAAATAATPTLAAIATAPASAPAPVASVAADVDACALLSVGDVQAKSPFTTPLATAESEIGHTTCLYSNFHVKNPTPEPVAVILRVTTFDSAADATAAFHVDEQDSTNLNVPPQPIAGVGDIAAAFPGGDEVVVEGVSGSRVVQVKLTGQFPDVSDPQKVPAGTAILKLAIARLP